MTGPDNREGEGKASSNVDGQLEQGEPRPSSNNVLPINLFELTPEEQEQLLGRVILGEEKNDTPEKAAARKRHPSVNPDYFRPSTDS